MVKCILNDAFLTPDVIQILRNKATEAPFSCDFAHQGRGSYLCRGCGLALYRSSDYFTSGCGWPSYDLSVQDAVIEHPDADGRRTQILCARCQGHLGHVFRGEHFTEKNTRHCVNGLAVQFVPDSEVETAAESVFAGGCFWGLEFLFAKLPGVLITEVGYIGGHTQQPNYAEVCKGKTGHLEAVRVVYDPAKLNYADLVRYFFEIHDPTQADGQGPDIGAQYLSALFYLSENEKSIALQTVEVLKNKKYKVVTQLLPATTFWLAEESHQSYYVKNGHAPYCHIYQKRF